MGTTLDTLLKPLYESLSGKLRDVAFNRIAQDFGVLELNKNNVYLYAYPLTSGICLILKERK